jgi:chromosome partitioning protein
VKICGSYLLLNIDYLSDNNVILNILPLPNNKLISDILRGTDMPTIVFASSKGGVGKTTSALALACVFAQMGAGTTLVDADPNAPLTKWAERFPDGVPQGLTVKGAIGNAAARVIDEAAQRDPFVIVDLEGTKNMEVSVGLGRADLALIPMQGSQLDADEAANVVKLVQSQEDVFRRTIPFRVFFTRTSPTIESKGMRDIVRQLRDFGIPTSIMEREAFRIPFRLGAGLYDITPSDVRNPRAAVENAEAFAAEIRDILLGDAQGEGREVGNG